MPKIFVERQEDEVEKYVHLDKIHLTPYELYKVDKTLEDGSKARSGIRKGMVFVRVERELVGMAQTERVNYYFMDITTLNQVIYKGNDLAVSEGDHVLKIIITTSY